MDDILKGLAAFLGALIVFTLGLLAWRQQLLDKRKFEVAETILLSFNKLKSAIETVRSTPPREGMLKYITEERRIDLQKRYDYYMGMRQWYYRITAEQRAVLVEAKNQFASSYTLASIYLPETTHILSSLNTCYWGLIRSAQVLGDIDPRPPHGEFWEDMLHELPDYAGNPDYEPTPESQTELERKHLWARYEDDPRDADVMNSIMWDAQNKLEEACGPHIEQGPYEFLHRFLRTLYEPLYIGVSQRVRRLDRWIKAR